MTKYYAVSWRDPQGWEEIGEYDYSFDYFSIPYQIWKMEKTDSGWKSVDRIKLADKRRSS